MTATTGASDFSVYAVLGGPFSVVHLVVVTMSMVAALVWLVGAVSLGFDAARGSSGCFGGRRWEETASTWGGLVFFATSTSNVAWVLAGPGVGLLTLLLLLTLLVVLLTVVVMTDRVGARRAQRFAATLTCRESGAGVQR